MRQPAAACRFRVIHGRPPEAIRGAWQIRLRQTGPWALGVTRQYNGGVSGVLLLLAWLWTQPPADVERLIEQGRAREAITLLEEAARKDPSSAVIQFQLGYALSAAGEDIRAIEAFRRVLQIDPGVRAARLNLAYLLVKTGRAEEALPLAQQCLEQDPEDPKAAFLFGRALAGAGQWRAAAEAYEKAARKAPDDVNLALAEAQAWERAGERGRAAGIYERFPDNPAALERLGVLALEAGDAATAIRHLEAARSKGQTPAVLYALATAYLRNKQLDQAAATAAALAEAEPASADVRLFYGRILRDQRKYAEAAAQFQAAARLQPSSGEAWNELTAALMLSKQYEAALQALERARQINGDTPAYDYFRATMLDALNQPKAALDSYRRFLSASNGRHPDEEFKARQRVRILERAAGR